MRSLGVSVSDFYFGPEQLDFFGTVSAGERMGNLNEAIDKIRRKYGNNVIQLAIVKKDPRLAGLDVKGEHVIHPYSFFRH